MFKKLFVCTCIILTCTWILHNTAYTHSGRTDANGGHYNRKTGEYHYHNGGTSSGRTSSNPFRSTQNNEDGIYLIAGAVILVGICWIIIDPDSCCLVDSEHIPNPARSFLSERPTPSSLGNRFWLPNIKIDTEGMNGWRLQATYTIRF